MKLVAASRPARPGAAARPAGPGAVRRPVGRSPQPPAGQRQSALEPAWAAARASGVELAWVVEPPVEPEPAPLPGVQVPAVRLQEGAAGPPLG